MLETERERLGCGKSPIISRHGSVVSESGGERDKEVVVCRAHRHVGWLPNLCPDRDRHVYVPYKTREFTDMEQSTIKHCVFSCPLYRVAFGIALKSTGQLCVIMYYTV